MIIYKSDVNKGAVLSVSGDWFSCTNEDGVISFNVPTSDRTPLYLKLFGFPGEPFRDEIDRFFNAVKILRRGSLGKPMRDFEEEVAHALGMTYGRYTEKKKAGGIRYIADPRRKDMYPRK